MANEIFVQLEVKVDKDEFHLHENRWFISTMSGLNAISHVQSIANTEEAINIGDVTAGGIMLLVNLDDANIVKVRPATGVADLVRIDPGEFAFFRLDDSATAPFALCDTAGDNAAEVLVILIDD
jgi:hypothetical protein